MEKVRFKHVYIIVSILIICILLFVNLLKSRSVISIKNKTEKDISTLQIIYHNLDKNEEVRIPIISPNQTYKTKIMFPENFIEGSLILSYLDLQGNKHEEYLQGYIEKSYSGKISVVIDSIDSNGVLTVTIKEGKGIL